MSAPGGSVLLVPPDLTAAVHLVWGNLENCSETPASVAGGDLLAKPWHHGQGISGWLRSELFK